LIRFFSRFYTVISTRLKLQKLSPPRGIQKLRTNAE